MRAPTTGELKTLLKPENEVSWLDIRGVAEKGWACNIARGPIVFANPARGPAAPVRRHGFQ